jgi:penicillin-binding protein 1A
MLTFWFVQGVATAIPDTEALRAVGTMSQATTLLDRDDGPAFTIFEEQRIEVPLDAVSPRLVEAIIAVEDQRFYEHGGVDTVRIAGAALANLRAGRNAQGASTITQQLARQSYLTLEKTFRRKIAEAIVALRLERQFSKPEILGFYLNKVYFGDGLYGVEAASRGYFGKPSAEVSVAEAALLAGLVQSPSAYAPTASLERATARRDLVLRLMRDQGTIDEDTYDAALAEPVALEDGLRRAEGSGQYFKEEVRRFLVERFGWERVYTGGLRVYTTIDVDMQDAAEAEVARALADIEKRQGTAVAPDGADPLQAALVAMDPHTGEIRAMVGGRDFAESSFNRATQAKRQPGSAFKPFVYAVALEQGMTPTTILTGLNEPVSTPEGDWVPDDANAEEESMTMRAALRTSSNRAAVRVLGQVGIPTAVNYARRLGVGSVPSVPSLALGSGEVTLQSMTAAYAAFANDGMVPGATLVRRVETTDGEVLYEGTQPARRAVTEATAYLMASMLADVVDAGTGASARSTGFRLPAAGKTGTTNDYHDAWFVGFTPRLVTGVWLGYDRPRPIMNGGYASQVAAPLWGRFMRTATDGDSAAWFEPPVSVTSVLVCRLSGHRATGECRDAVTTAEDGTLVHGSSVYVEHFLRGTEPLDDCPIHRRPFGRAVHALASLFSPSRRAEEVAVPALPDAREPRATAPAPEAEAEPESPEERRGFWGRLFGLGRNRR